MISIAKFKPEDFLRWRVLAEGYKTFYKTTQTEAEYQTTWQRLLTQEGVLGLGAHVDGKLVGIAHYFFHTSVWAPTACYLQDLFVDDTVRGQGIARALIEAVAEQAKLKNAARFYWLTHKDNQTARALYDKIARHGGMIRYDYAL